MASIFGSSASAISSRLIATTTPSIGRSGRQLASARSRTDHPPVGSRSTTKLPGGPLGRRRGGLSTRCRPLLANDPDRARNDEQYDGHRDDDGDPDEPEPYRGSPDRRQHEHQRQDREPLQHDSLLTWMVPLLERE